MLLGDAREAHAPDDEATPSTSGTAGETVSVREMRLAILPVALAAAVLVSGCGGGNQPAHSAASASPATSSPTPRAKTVTYSLESTSSERGVTLALKRIVVPPNGPAELVMDIANWSKRPGPDLEFDPSRVVVRQAGRRISSKSGPSAGLTYGGSAKGFTVQLTGFRPDLPYTITAAVLADTGLRKVPSGWHRPLRFRWRFGAKSVTASATT